MTNCGLRMPTRSPPERQYLPTKVALRRLRATHSDLTRRSWACFRSPGCVDGRKPVFYGIGLLVNLRLARTERAYDSPVRLLFRRDRRAWSTANGMKQESESSHVAGSGTPEAAGALSRANADDG